MDALPLDKYRRWVKAGAPDSFPEQREFLRVAALASVVRGVDTIDDTSTAMAHIAILRRAWMRRDPAPPFDFGCDAALTDDGRKVVLVVPCFDGDVYVHIARRGHPLVSILIRYFEIFDIDGATAIISGMARRIGLCCEQFGWPTRDEIAQTREQINAVLLELHRLKYPKMEKV